MSDTSTERRGPTEPQEFTEHRGHLVAVAYRMLGSRADAEDAVQEAWLRYAATDTSQVRDLRAWLTTVTGRICLDVLRSARTRRESYVGQWLPEPIVERMPDADDSDPADQVALADRVSIALLLVLETLTPEQRVAFVLHDVFALRFDEVAETLGTTVENARQLASRARKAVAGGERRHTTDRNQQRRVLTAFMAAVRGGDLDALLRLLAPDVIAIGDGGGTGPAAKVPVVGAERVARFLLGVFRQAEQYGMTLEPAVVNGDLGYVARTGKARWRGLGENALFVGAISVSPEGRITGLYHQLNPEKLIGLDDFR